VRACLCSARARRSCPIGRGGCELGVEHGPEISSVTLAWPAQMAYGQGMAGLPGAMPGYPSMYHQPQYPAYMAAPYGLNTPYLGGMHPGFAAYPQARPRLGHVLCRMRCVLLRAYGSLGRLSLAALHRCFAVPCHACWAVRVSPRPTEATWAVPVTQPRER